MATQKSKNVPRSNMLRYAQRPRSLRQISWDARQGRIPWATRVTDSPTANISRRYYALARKTVFISRVGTKKLQTEWTTMIKFRLLYKDVYARTTCLTWCHHRRRRLVSSTKHRRRLSNTMYFGRRHNKSRARAHWIDHQRKWCPVTTTASPATETFRLHRATPVKLISPT